MGMVDKNFNPKSCCNSQKKSPNLLTIPKQNHHSGSGNGFAQNRWQSITWLSDGPVLGLNELMNLLVVEGLIVNCWAHNGCTHSRQEVIRNTEEGGWSLTLTAGYWVINTFRVETKWPTFKQTTFSTAYSQWNNHIMIKISLKFVLDNVIHNMPSLIKIMAWRLAGDKPSSEPMMVQYWS